MSLDNSRSKTMRRVSAFSAFSSKSKKGKGSSEDTPKSKASPDSISLSKTLPSVSGSSKKDQSKKEKLLKVLKGGSLRRSFRRSINKTMLPDVTVDSSSVPNSEDPDCELTDVKKDSPKKNGGSKKPPLPKSKGSKKTAPGNDNNKEQAESSTTNDNKIKTRTPKNEQTSDVGSAKGKKKVSPAAQSSSGDTVFLFSPPESDVSQNHEQNPQPSTSGSSKRRKRSSPTSLTPTTKRQKKKDESTAEVDIAESPEKSVSENLNNDEQSGFPPEVFDSALEARKAFEFLIHPVTSDTFFREMWERKPLMVKRHLPGYNAGIFSTAELDQILKKKNIQFTENLDVVSYVNNRRETHNPVGRAYAPVVWDYYQMGCSIRLLNPQTYSKTVWEFLAKLQEFFGCSVGANIYLTPPGTQGFAPHYDDIEAFILQLEGKKHWRLYGPRKKSETLPRYSSENLSQEELGEPILDKILEAGDMLYFPRGTIHQGRTCGNDHSLHITVSTFQKNTWGDYLMKLLPSAVHRAMELNVEYREGLPLDYLDYMGLVNCDRDSSDRSEFIKKVSRLIVNLVNYAPLDAACDQMGKQFVVDSLPPVLSQAEQLSTIHSAGERWNSKEKCVTGTVKIKPDTRIKLIRKGAIRMLTEEKEIRIYHCLENARIFREVEPQYIEVQVEIAQTVEYLVHSYPKYVTVASLPRKSMKEKVNIAKEMYEKGLLLIEGYLNKTEEEN